MAGKGEQVNLKDPLIICGWCTEDPTTMAFGSNRSIPPLLSTIAYTKENLCYIQGPAGILEENKYYLLESIGVVNESQPLLIQAIRQVESIDIGKRVTVNNVTECFACACPGHHRMGTRSKSHFFHDQSGNTYTISSNGNLGTALLDAIRREFKCFHSKMTNLIVHGNPFGSKFSKRKDKSFIHEETRKCLKTVYREGYFDHVSTILAENPPFIDESIPWHQQLEKFLDWLKSIPLAVALISLVSNLVENHFRKKYRYPGRLPADNDHVLKKEMHQQVFHLVHEVLQVNTGEVIDPFPDPRFQEIMIRDKEKGEAIISSITTQIMEEHPFSKETHFAGGSQDPGSGSEDDPNKA
ncbi:hypothetical protein GF325_09180, partial [Candidatus Bathyarchaeota archaeon]|nr:hypothetical protein [Candidatus Bathyarchaeota archaeon]